MPEPKSSPPVVTYQGVLTGQPAPVVARLSRKLNCYKKNYSVVKVGITGRPPEERFKEHLRGLPWEKMAVIYDSGSERNVNTQENYLI